MKKIALLLVGLAIVAGSAFAQQNAGINSTFTYRTTASVAGSSFNWYIYQRGTTTPVVAGDTTYLTTSTLGVGGVNNVVIKWLGTGTYDVFVREITANSCDNPTTDQRQEVDVVGNNSINFTAPLTIAAACWNAAAQVLPVNFTYALGGSDYPIVITADVVLNGDPAVSQTFTINSGDPLEISVANFLNNTETVNVTNSIAITSTTLNGSLISVGTDHEVTHVVYAKPATGTITIE